MRSHDDLPIRLAVFAWLEEQVAIHGEVLAWRDLQAGVVVAGERVPLVSMQGIFTPKVCRLPLSIRTSHEGPYADTFSADGLLLYKYRGTDPRHRDNRGLRQAMREGTPLVYLHGHAEGRYHAIWPVFVVGDDPAALTFTVEADDASYLPELSAAGAGASSVAGEIAEPRRRYVTTTVRQRLHQAGFRERVLHAYRDRCALCRLRHRELLDAAHIVPDTDPEGEPLVRNGLSLCKIHHAAYDKFVLAVDPDYRVVVRPDVLEEHDGPMLRHGLQELHGTRITAPRKPELAPDRDRLAQRFEEFWRRAG